MARGTADWSRKRPLIRYTTGDDVDELAYRINERISEIRDHITGTTGDIETAINTAASNIRDHITSTTSDIEAAVNTAASSIQATVETTSAEIRNAVINTAQETRDAVVDAVSDAIHRLTYYNRLIPTGRLVFQAVAEHIPQMMTYYDIETGLRWYLLFEQYLFGNAVLRMEKTVPGDHYQYFYHYFAASLEGKISGEVDVVNTGSPFDGGVWLKYTKNGRERRFYLRYVSNTGTVYIRGYPDVWVTVATDVTIRSDYTLCYPLKVVGDPSTNRYVRVYVGNRVFDVSSYEAVDIGSTPYDDYGIYFGHGMWSTGTGAMVVNAVSFCHKEE